jgi:hypothetical protein
MGIGARLWCPEWQAHLVKTARDPLTLAKGYMTFQPAFEQRELDKMKQEYVNNRLLLVTIDSYSHTMFDHREIAAADLPPSLVEVPAQSLKPSTPDASIKDPPR